jgi:Putative metal-binding motif
MVRTLFAWSVLAWLALLLAPAAAFARQGGIAADGCNGCHTGGAVPTITLTTDPVTISPGQLVTVTVSIPTVNGPAAGLYLRASKGTLSVIAGEGTKLLGGGVTHSAVKRAPGAAAVIFRIGWTAPAAPGGVDFDVFGVAANGDGSSRNDGAGYGFLSVTYGCTGITFYRDLDGDGFGGTLSGTTRDCSKPMYFSAVVGDCNDNDERIFPGAKEVCNGRDENCDGKIDEGLAASATVYPDADGDGHGAQGSAAMGITIVGCTLPKGYGFGTDDCDDTKPFVYAGATEICNYIDDNCNGRVDEDVRLACGLGWCRRLAAGCGTDLCTPGQPRAEVCNAFDDDCDGVNDNGTDAELCGASGLTCVEGYCVAAGTVPDAGRPPPPDGSVVAGTAGVPGTGGKVGSGTGAGGSAQPTGTGGSGGSTERAHGGCAVAGVSVAGNRVLAALCVLSLLAGVARRARRRKRRATGADRPS